jgi:hypothetical protein
MYHLHPRFVQLPLRDPCHRPDSRILTPNMTVSLQRMAFVSKQRKRVSWKRSITKMQRAKKKPRPLCLPALAAHPGRNLEQNSRENCLTLLPSQEHDLRYPPSLRPS